MRDPSVESWRAALGQSTSAQLRQTQAALHASQADLTAMQRQRDAAQEMHAEAANEARVMRATATRYLESAEKLSRELATANHQNRILAAENEAALRRLNEKEGKS